MVSIYCDTDDWSSSLNKALNESPHLNQVDAHISINCLTVNENKKYNILLLQESPAFLKYKNIIEQIQNYPKDIEKKYSKVYSSIKYLQNFNFVEYIHPCNPTWIQNPQLFPFKNKNISMITSNKSFLPGHQKRLQIMNAVKDFVDVYGRGFKEIKNKSEGLLDYYFSVAIENDATDDYFSEKILDCFMTSTIPIYFGSDCVYKFFNPKGIINIKEFNDLKDIKSISKDMYFNNIDAIADNYFIAKQHDRQIYSVLKIILTKLYYENI